MGTVRCVHGGTHWTVPVGGCLHCGADETIRAGVWDAWDSLPNPNLRHSSSSAALRGPLPLNSNRNRASPLCRLNLSIAPTSVSNSCANPRFPEYSSFSRPSRRNASGRIAAPSAQFSVIAILYPSIPRPTSRSFMHGPSARTASACRLGQSASQPINRSAKAPRRSTPSSTATSG